MMIRFVWKKAPKSLGYRNEEKTSKQTNKKNKKN